GVPAAGWRGENLKALPDLVERRQALLRQGRVEGRLDAVHQRHPCAPLVDDVSALDVLVRVKAQVARVALGVLQPVEPLALHALPLEDAPRLKRGVLPVQEGLRGDQELIKQLRGARRQVRGLSAETKPPRQSGAQGGQRLIGVDSGAIEAGAPGAPGGYHKINGRPASQRARRGKLLQNLILRSGI